MMWMLAQDEWWWQRGVYRRPDVADARIALAAALAGCRDWKYDQQLQCYHLRWKKDLPYWGSDGVLYAHTVTSVKMVTKELATSAVSTLWLGEMFEREWLLAELHYRYHGDEKSSVPPNHSHTNGP